MENSQGLSDSVTTKEDLISWMLNGEGQHGVGSVVNQSLGDSAR